MDDTNAAPSTTPTPIEAREQNTQAPGQDAQPTTAAAPEATPASDAPEAEEKPEEGTDAPTQD